MDGHGKNDLPAPDAPGIEHAHRVTAPAEHVEVGGAGGPAAARYAQLLSEDVLVVVARGGQAPGVILGAPDEHVQAQAGRGDALGVDTGSLQLLLVDDLRVVVAELRA